MAVTPVEGSKRVVDISDKRDVLLAIRSKMGLIVCKEAPESDESCIFIDAVEMFQVQTDRGVGLIGTYIGKIVATPGNDDNGNTEYFMYELGPKSPYVAEYRRVVSGLIEAPSGLIV